MRYLYFRGRAGADPRDAARGAADRAPARPDRPALLALQHEPPDPARAARARRRRSPPSRSASPPAGAGTGTMCSSGSMPGSSGAISSSSTARRSRSSSTTTSLRDPLGVYRAACRHIGVDEGFVPDMRDRAKPDRGRAMRLWRAGCGGRTGRARRLLRHAAPVAAPLIRRLKDWNAAPVPKLDPALHRALIPRFRADLDGRGGRRSGGVAGGRGVARSQRPRMV